MVIVDEGTRLEEDKVRGEGAARVSAARRTFKTGAGLVPSARWEDECTGKSHCHRESSEAGAIFPDINHIDPFHRPTIGRNCTQMGSN